MKIELNNNISWFYLDKTIQILDKLNREVTSLKGQELDFWLEIDKNSTYNIILLNLTAQMDLEKTEVKRLFDEFVDNMELKGILIRV